MKRWTDGLPGGTKRLGAMMALRGLSASQPRMRADTHDGPEQIAPLQRPDTLMQLSRSLSWKSILYRTAGPYIMARRVTSLWCQMTDAIGGEADIPRAARGYRCGAIDPKRSLSRSFDRTAK